MRGVLRQFFEGPARGFGRLRGAWRLLNGRGMRVLLALALLPTIACTDAATPPEQHLPRPADPTFTLFVSNQSFDLDRVDITVKLDGQLAVSGDFDVEGQHTWIKFDFALAPGPHELEAVTVDGETSLVETFEMDDRKWGVLNFWFYGPDHYEPTPRQFSFDVMNEEPRFQ